MTYNVHSFVGADGSYAPERVARVIEACQADLVALQEVDSGRSTDRVPPWFWLAERLGMTCHFTLTRNSGHGHFGNALLSRHQFELMAEGPLPRRRDEARGVQWFKVATADWELHLMNTHFSVRLRERSLQLHSLMGAEWFVRAGLDLPLVICGDLNSSPWSLVYRRLADHLSDVQRWGGGRGRATWPSRLPMFRIDHMFVSKQVRVAAAEVPRNALTRSASDHLPLYADLAFSD